LFSKKINQKENQYDQKTVLAGMLILLSSTAMAESAKEYIANIGVEANLHGLERVKQTLVAPPSPIK